MLPFLNENAAARYRSGYNVLSASLSVLTSGFCILANGYYLWQACAIRYKIW